jgi:hypothetical protein
MTRDQGRIGKRARRAAARTQAPLDSLQRLKAGSDPFLTAFQVDAARRLQRDFERAQLRQRLTRDASQALPGHQAGVHASAAIGVSALDAKRRCLAALDAAGPGLSDLLFETVCMEHGLVEAERAFGWPARSAKAILRLALDRLVVHYGLVSGGRRGGRIEMWRAEAGTA